MTRWLDNLLVNTPAFDTKQLAEYGFLATFFIYNELNTICVGLSK